MVFLLYELSSFYTILISGNARMNWTVGPFQISCLSNSTRYFHGRSFVGQYYVAYPDACCIEFSHMVPLFPRMCQIKIYFS